MPEQLESVNVMTENWGLTSAIFFNHSEHAPQGLRGFISLIIKLIIDNQ